MFANASETVRRGKVVTESADKHNTVEPKIHHHGPPIIPPASSNKKAAPSKKGNPDDGDGFEDIADRIGVVGQGAVAGKKYSRNVKAAKGVERKTPSDGRDSGGKLDLGRNNKKPNVLAPEVVSSFSREWAMPTYLTDAGEVEIPSQVTFEELRVIFSSSCPVPAAEPKPFPLAGDTQKGVMPPTYSSQLTRSRKPPTAAFSPAAVLAAQQNLNQRGTSERAQMITIGAPSDHTESTTAVTSLASVLAAPKCRGKLKYGKRQEKENSNARPPAYSLNFSTAGTRRPKETAPTYTPSLPPTASSTADFAELRLSRSPPLPSTPCDRGAGPPPPTSSPTNIINPYGTLHSLSPTWSSSTPPLSSPPPFAKPIAERKARKEAADDLVDVVDAPVADTDEPCSKRESNVWYGIWEGRGCHPDMLQEKTCAAEAVGGCKLSREIRGVSGAVRPGGVGGGIIASLAMASPRHSSVADGSPPLSPAYARGLQASSPHLATLNIDNNTPPAVAAPSRLPPTVPRVVPIVVGFHSAKVAAAPETAVYENKATVTATSEPELFSPSWSGAALRQKSVRWQLPPSRDGGVREEGWCSSSRAASRLASPPSPFYASVSSRLPITSDEGGVVRVVHLGSGRNRSTDGKKGESVGGTEQQQRQKRRPWIWQGRIRSSARGAGVCDGRSGATDGWAERPPGVGPWPLVDKTREGVADHDVAGGGGTSGRKRSGGGGGASGRAADTSIRENAAAKTFKIAATPSSSEEVSMANISADQPARLRALRENLENNRSWSRGDLEMASNASVPKGFLRSNSGRPGVVTKPLGVSRGRIS